MPLTEAFATRKTCYGPPKQSFTEKVKNRVRKALEQVFKANPYRDEEGSYTTKAKDAWHKGRGAGVDAKDTMRIANLAKAGPKALSQAATMAKSITTFEKAHRRANAAEAAGHTEMAKIFRDRAFALGKQKIIAGRSAAKLTAPDTMIGSRGQVMTEVTGPGAKQKALDALFGPAGKKPSWATAGHQGEVPQKAKESFEHLKSHDAAVQQLVGLSNLGGKMQRNAAAQKLADKITDPDIVGQLAKSADIVGEFALSDLFNERRIALQKSKAAEQALTKPKGTGSAFEKYMQAQSAMAKNKAAVAAALEKPSYYTAPKKQTSTQDIDKMLEAAGNKVPNPASMNKFLGPTWGQGKNVITTPHVAATTVTPKEAATTAGAKPPSGFEAKDKMRIDSMVKASMPNGWAIDPGKLHSKAQTMANAITNWEKAHRRANAAQAQSLGKVAQIFRNRADVLARKS